MPFEPWIQMKPRVRTVPVIVKRRSDPNGGFMSDSHFMPVSFPWVSLSIEKPVTFGRPVRIFFHSKPWKSQSSASAMASIHFCPWTFCHANRYRYINQAPRMWGRGVFYCCLGGPDIYHDNTLTLEDKFLFTRFTVSYPPTQDMVVPEYKWLKESLDVILDAKNPKRALEFDWRVPAAPPLDKD